MEIKINSIVTRISHNHDVIFKVLNIKDNICYLKGENIRLYADSPIDDLKIYQKEKEDNFENKIEEEIILDRNEYFYIPAKILHCDSDISLSNTS